MSLFPLPVTPFEHYLWADDRLDYPMTFFMRLKFRGEFERPRFYAALKDALQQHPLLRAFVRGSPANPTSRLFWIGAGQALPIVVWRGTPIRFDHVPTLDLTQEIGLRIWICQGEGHAELLLQIHHVCCDGIGALQFLNSLIAAYDSSSSEATIQSESSDFRHVRRGASSWSWWRRLATSHQRILRVLRYLRSKPSPLAVPETEKKDSPKEPAYPAVVSHVFSETETSQIVATAKRSATSVNALLMRDGFLALDRWNRRYLNDEGGRLIRLVVPVNLRDGSHASVSAFNAISYAFIDRHSWQLNDSAELLQSVHDELNEAKQLRRSLAFLPVLKFFGQFPDGVASLLSSDRCLGTAVFSSLGAAFAGTKRLGTDGRLCVGELVLDEIEAAPPVRPGTLASFAILTYAKRLTICLSYDARLLSADQAADLLTLLIDGIRTSIS